MQYALSPRPPRGTPSRGWQPSIARRRIVHATSLGLALLLAACAARPEPPTPDAPATYAPNLAGRTVMVLPAQPGPSATSAPDAEAVPGFDADLAFFLNEHAPRVRWVPAAEVERTITRTPTLRIKPRGLEVADFFRMRLQRVGDPLFGDLHALGVLLDARYALLPYAVQYVPGTGGEAGRVEVSAAVIDTGNGNVLWIGAVAGTRGPENDPQLAASAASALAERLKP